MLNPRHGVFSVKLGVFGLWMLPCNSTTQFPNGNLGRFIQQQCQWTWSLQSNKQEGWFPYPTGVNNLKFTYRFIAFQRVQSAYIQTWDTNSTICIAWGGKGDSKANVRWLVIIISSIQHHRGTGVNSWPKSPSTAHLSLTVFSYQHSAFPASMKSPDQNQGPSSNAGARSPDLTDF